MASDSPVTPMMPHIVTQATWGCLRTAARLPQGGLDHGGELGRHGVGLGLHPRLDHDAHEWLGAARAQQDPAVVAELGLGLDHGLPYLGAVGQALGPRDRHVDEALGHPLDQPRRQVGQRASGPQHQIGQRDAGEDAVTGGRARRKMM